MYFAGGNVDKDAFSKRVTKIYKDYNCSSKAVSEGFKWVDILSEGRNYDSVIYCSFVACTD